MKRDRLYGDDKLASFCKQPSDVSQVEREAGKPLPAWVKANVPNWLLPWAVFSGGPPPAPPQS